MFRRPDPVPADETASASAGSSVRLDQPHDTCLRCGRPTPVGVSLCERDNPGRIKSPSATQVHGTILIGVIAGFVGLLLLLRLASAGAGPFTSTLSGVAPRADGGFDVVVQVSNTGSRTSGASCRVSLGGAPDYRDYTFFTEPIPAGETRRFARSLAPISGPRPVNASAIVVRCN